MSSMKDNLILLFDRPSEPVFTPKGDQNAVFQVPQTYLTDRYSQVGTELQNKFVEDSEVTIPVKSIDIPNLDVPMKLPRRDVFSLFVPAHRKMAGRLIDIFMKMPNLEDLQSFAVYCHDRINPYLYNYCLSVALLHRKDTKNVPIPSLIGIFPGKFIDSAVFAKVREESTVVPDGSREPIIIPKDYTASDLNEEHSVAYFREDMGINLHHWHWHLVYPFDATDERIVRKDRRGELFYYMHQQIVARYNFERLSNGLSRVKMFNDLSASIPEAYFPKMDSLVASRAWPPRFANTKLADLNRAEYDIKLDLSDLEQWKERFLSAIEKGFAVGSNNQMIPLTEDTGIDTLGNMMEASSISPNRQFYGDMHNMGHLFIALSHDPDNRHLETFSVMGDSATTMRDPMFYRWHAFINYLFHQHKKSLPRYTEAMLNFPNITVTGVSVNVEGSGANQFQTFWQESDIDLSRGMDFCPRVAIFARFTHLQHAPFTYNITVNNSTGSKKQGTCRIFMAPKNDEKGKSLLFRDQKHLMIELDKFAVTLNPGRNNIQRQSSQSTVTIPFERTFRNLEQNRPPAGSAEEAEFNFCGCGWPDHMLIPKGNQQGLAAELFVMISNYADDKVAQDISGIPCSDAESYCGIRDRLYPDRKPMGYPFDRLPREGVKVLSEFLTPNMRVQDCTITFRDITQMRNKAH